MIENSMSIYVIANIFFKAKKRSKIFNTNNKIILLPFFNEKNEKTNKLLFFFFFESKETTKKINSVRKAEGFLFYRQISLFSLESHTDRRCFVTDKSPTRVLKKSNGSSFCILVEKILEKESMQYSVQLDLLKFCDMNRIKLMTIVKSFS